ncbi:MAG: hypothetical protein IKI50_07385 [Clostridia bacterium]|nr:hypothetical protein [Clostridia bacterium]
MKRIRWVLLLCLILCLPVCAQQDQELYGQWYEQQRQASGADELPQALPPETRELLERLGVVGWDGGQVTDVDLDRSAGALWDLLAQQAKKPLAGAVCLFGVCLLYAWLRGLRETVAPQPQHGRDLFGLVCTGAVCACLLAPLTDCLQQVCRALQSMGVFITAFLPVLAGILISGGTVTAAAGYQAAMLVAAQIISLLGGTMLSPLMSTALACGMTGALAPELRLHAVGEAINKTVSWVVGITAAVFTGLLSVKNILGTAVDSVGNRAVKFSLSSLVPVVGNSMGEAFAAIRSCLRLLGTAVGCFGMLACAGIVLPPLLHCAVTGAFLRVCGWMAEAMDLPPLAELMRCGRSCIRTLIALLCASALVMIVSTAVVTVARAAG